MDNHEINPKPQPTGQLKLMTVFIAVLALHIVAIGGYAVYHLMSAGTSDADLLGDKTHRDVKVSPDAMLPGDTTVTETDKPASTVPADASNSASAPTTVAAAPAPTSAPATPSTTILGPTSETTASTAPAAPSFPVVSPPANAAPMDGGTVAMTPENDTSTTVATYTVRKGDTLARIAHKVHLSVTKLRSANNLASDKLRIGQKITLPGKEEATTAIATSAEPTGEIADPAPAPAAPLSHHAAMAASGHHLYTVAKGDTLSKIAHHFKTTTKALMAANDISDPSKLSIGRKLRIPSASAHNSISSAPAHAPADQEEPAPKAAPAAQLVNLTQ